MMESSESKMDSELLKPPCPLCLKMPNSWTSDSFGRTGASPTTPNSRRNVILTGCCRFSDSLYTISRWSVLYIGAITPPLSHQKIKAPLASKITCSLHSMNFPSIFFLIKVVTGVGFAGHRNLLIVPRLPSLPKPWLSFRRIPDCELNSVRGKRNGWILF